ncbi:MAG: aminoacyl-histidine dipeptidase [Lachnospiraceae bacterium]|nr:aminoacyl-histidine dipeptidase [Lachnospiraceae bacterium]
MSDILKGLTPEAVFRYFEEICNIPHGSGNTKAISNYLAGFAKQRGLRYVQEPCGNVIIYADATPGYENEPGIVLQGHMDMVAVKEESCAKDMMTEGLDLFTDGTLVGARGTSLGGDDGIALAYALAVLSDPTIPHPALDFVATIDEETGMDGAHAIDPAHIRGRRLLNIDSEEEGIFIVGCAGGATLRLHLSLARESFPGKCYTVSVRGLQGGHSGTEIEKNRSNAILLLARVLKKLKKDRELRVISIIGGTKDNVIPSEAAALVKAASAPDVKAVTEELRRALAGKEDGLQIVVSEASAAETDALTKDSEEALLKLLNLLPFGVQAMSVLPGLVETSDNVGIIRSDGSEAEIAVSVRSLFESEKETLCAKIISLAELLGATVTRNSEYPGWQYRAESPLREKAVAAYTEQYGEAPLVQTIHAGLECGLLLAKLPDLDAISMGPNINDIHSTKERLEIASVQRTWELLKKVLAAKDGWASHFSERD